VNVFVLEADVDVVLAGGDRDVDERHDSIFLFLLDDVRLAGSVDFHVDVFCATHTASFS